MKTDLTKLHCKKGHFSNELNSLFFLSKLVILLSILSIVTLNISKMVY